MKIVSLNLNELPSVLFWDTNVDALSLEEDYFFIISRILKFTNEKYFLNNIKILTDTFDIQTIINVVDNTDEFINDDVLNLIKYDCSWLTKELSLQ